MPLSFLKSCWKFWIFYKCFGRCDNLTHIVRRNVGGHSNGNAFDAQGRLVACEHSPARLVRYEWDGSVSVLADQFNGKRLNAPNDLVALKVRRLERPDRISPFISMPLTSSGSIEQIKDASPNWRSERLSKLALDESPLVFTHGLRMLALGIIFLFFRCYFFYFFFSWLINIFIN